MICNIRRPRAAEYDDVVLLEECFPKSQRCTLDDYRAMRATCYVATLPGKLDFVIVGAVWIRYNEIASISVFGDVRGKGYGEILLRFAMKKVLARRKEVHLDVAVENVGAQRLYLNQGFRPTAYDAHHYGRNKGALHMVYRA